MTKITTDFVGTESTVVTKSRLTQILAYWGASTAGYTTWGQARTDLNYRLLNTTAGVIGNEELAGSFLPKINFLNDPDSMILTALFGAGEQGVWFDPSDVANVAWRRNLLLWTESFDNAVWEKTSVTALGAAVTISAGGRLSQYFARSSQADYVAKIIASGTGTIVFGIMTGGYATIASQTITLTSTPIAYTIAGSLAGGATLVGLTFTSSAGATATLSATQLETGSTATEYQRITDLNTEIIARFPNATMYQDAAGTTPVYAPNQPVGLRLDKSKGLVLGTELVTNGDFSGGTTGWTAQSGTTFNVTDGVASVGGASPSYAGQSFTTVVGRTYKATATLKASPSLASFGGVRKADTLTAGGTVVGIITSNTATFTDQTSTVYFSATSTTTWITIQSNSFGTVNVDNISVKELPGNHAVQSTDISRPLYGIEPAGGRRNLLTYSEQMDNAVWIKASGAAITANTDTAPDGTLTADTLTTSGVPSFGAGLITQAVSVAATGVTFTFSVYLKASSTNKATIWINLAGGAERVAVVVNLTSSYQRYTVSATFTSGSIVYPHVVAGDANLGTNAGSVFLWGAQLELNTAPTPYQKVVSDYEVTEAGVQTCHYCNYDGTNDGMVTNSINFTATDKMSVFVAVRKLSDAVVGMIAELSADSNTNAGSFNFFAPLSTGSGGVNYSSGSRGSVALSGPLRVDITGTAPAPDASVLSSINDIAGDLTTLRRNAVVAGTGTGDKGTGTFGNYPLYIGRRGGASLPFNGRDYGIIVTGKLASSTQIGNAENFLLNKLGSLAPVITGVPTIGVN